MKTARSLAALLVVAALAFFVYDYYRNTDRREASAAAAILRERTLELQQQAQELNQRLRSVNETAAALKNAVADQRRDLEEKRAQQLAEADLAEGFVVAAIARTAVAEDYRTTLQWPESNRAAGIPEASQLKGRSLQRVQVSGRGVVTLTYDGKSGVAGGIVTLIPAATGGGAVRWRCESPSYANIESAIAECRYTGTRP